MKRLFTFGCSFTKYHWGTWADIIAYSYPNAEYYNYGEPDGSNQITMSRLMEADQRYNLNQDDIVIICWTNVGRESRYLPKYPDKLDMDWKKSGNIPNAALYDEEFKLKYCYPMHFLIRDLAILKSVTCLLKHKKVPYYFLAINNIAKDIYTYTHSNVDTNTYTHSNVDTNTLPMYQELVTLYKPHLDEIRPNYFDIIFKGDWYSNIYTKVKFKDNGVWPDCHPTPNDHVQYLKLVLPEIELTEEAISLAQQETDILLSKIYELGLPGAILPLKGNYTCPKPYF